MFDIKKLFSSKAERDEHNDMKNNRPVLDMDAIAGILKTNPCALGDFEKAYEKQAIEEPDYTDLFETSSKQASEIVRVRQSGASAEDAEALDALKNRIVDELLADTRVYVFDGKEGRIEDTKALPDGTPFVTNQDISAFPAAVRPQLAGELMCKDLSGTTFPHLLYFYQQTMDNTIPEKNRQYAYNMFRQGLDILDLDAVTYEMLGQNKNSMGYWLPSLVSACQSAPGSGLRIPATTVAKVPITLLQLSRKEYGELTKTTLDIVDSWAYHAFHLDESKDYFIKTGTYSSKFDFRNAHVTGAKEVRELGEYLLFIQNQAVLMAGPLTQPSIYGMSTTNEWVVREFIPDKEKNPCIYKGLPLHTEYRVFVDCDKDIILGQTPYWEPNVMKTRFAQGSDANSPHKKHDYVIYKAHEETLMKRYHENLSRVLQGIQAILPHLNLPGQWAVDVMLNGDDLWIIDLSLAEQSFFYKACVPEELRNPTDEDWIPTLPVPKAALPGRDN